MHFFTPEEATQTLPLVKSIVRDILKMGQKARALAAIEKQELKDLEDLQKSSDRLVELFSELEELGCSYKDWNYEVGLVDFPAMIEGQPVLLCWRSDEAQLKFYHSWNEGFSARKVIPGCESHVEARTC